MWHCAFTYTWGVGVRCVLAQVHSIQRRPSPRRSGRSLSLTAVPRVGGLGGLQASSSSLFGAASTPASTTAFSGFSGFGAATAAAPAAFGAPAAASAPTVGFGATTSAFGTLGAGIAASSPGMPSPPHSNVRTPKPSHPSRLFQPTKHPASHRAVRAVCETGTGHWLRTPVVAQPGFD
jgi:hypothetical protein